MKKKIVSKYFLVLVLVLNLVCLSETNVFAMSSSNYQIKWDSINAGGTDHSGSANYRLHDTLGQFGPGHSSSSSYGMDAGYRQRDEPKRLTFTVRSQDNSTRVSYTAFDSASFTVTVSSVAGYSVGDYIAVVEDVGPSQDVAVGQITEINVLVITVDKWSGDQASIAAGPAGGDDYVFNLNTNSMNLGTLTSQNVSVAVAMTEIDTNAEDGYSITVVEDHGLQLGDGPQVIDDVADNTVTAGDEEYGIETTGDNAQGANDWAITSSEQQTGDSSAFADKERVAIIYKASIEQGITPAGGYNHMTHYYAVVKY